MAKMVKMRHPDSLGAVPSTVPESAFHNHWQPKGWRLVEGSAPVVESEGAMVFELSDDEETFSNEETEQE